MDHNLKFVLPDGYDEQQLINELAGDYSIKKEPVYVDCSVIYETFDWRLFNKSLVLYESDGELFLRRLSKNRIIQKVKITTPPRFIWDFPESKLKEQLASIIEMRTLLKLVEIYSQSSPYRVLNQDEKTVAYLVYEEIKLSHQKDMQPLAIAVWIKPVRGYSKYAGGLARRFKEIGLTTTEQEDIYFKALAAVGKQPGDYSTKLDIPLDPDMRADEATKAILRFLLGIMKRNKANIKTDLDTEFLHDFRVAVRRTRAALSQIKFVFPAEITGRFKRDFAFLGKLSNQLRDLDVYLLNEDTYKAMLPTILREDITPLFDYLREKRVKALEEVISGLNSKEYDQILQDWEAFLNEPVQDSPAASNANQPIIHVARKRIYKRYRSIVKSGRLILEHAEDEQLHALRIECKKLRYLMEFFAGVFPGKKIAGLIKQLKQLQDNLGDFNDLCVQEEYLQHIAQELPLTDQQSRKVLLAIGSLIGTLDQEKQLVKDSFAEIFTNYASPSNQKLFRTLFASKKKEAAL